MPKVAKGRKFRGVLKNPPVPSENASPTTTTETKGDVAKDEVDKKSNSIAEDQSLQNKFGTEQPPLSTDNSDAKQSPDLPKSTTEPKVQSLLPQENSSSLSRGQRKRLAKREKYLRRERLILDSLKLKRQEEQAKRIDGLDAIKEALLATVNDEKQDNTTIKPVVSLLKSNRGQKHLVEKEVSHMNLVLQHPAFQAEPFAAIREHLRNTIVKKSSPTKNETPKDTDKVKRKRHKSKYRATRSKRR